MVLPSASDCASLRTEGQDHAGALERGGQQEFAFLERAEGVKRYEYAVLVTSHTDTIEVLAQHYPDPPDVENSFDELKN
jgi:hypothetical protein